MYTETSDSRSPSPSPSYHSSADDSHGYVTAFNIDDIDGETSAGALAERTARLNIGGMEKGTPFGVDGAEAQRQEDGGHDGEKTQHCPGDRGHQHRHHRHREHGPRGHHDHGPHPYHEHRRHGHHIHHYRHHHDHRPHPPPPFHRSDHGHATDSPPSPPLSHHPRHHSDSGASMHRPPPPPGPMLPPCHTCDHEVPPPPGIKPCGRNMPHAAPTGPHCPPGCLSNHHHAEGRPEEHGPPFPFVGGMPRPPRGAFGHRPPPHLAGGHHPFPPIFGYHYGPPHPVHMGNGMRGGLGSRGMPFGFGRGMGMSVGSRGV